MKIANVQRFCIHDGPGVRTIFFLKGCPLRCVWCHNPETQRMDTELLYYPGKCIGCGACRICGNGVHDGKDNHEIDRNNCVCCGRCAQTCPTGALELCGEVYTPESLLAVAMKDRAFYGDRGGVTLSGGEPFAQPEESISFLKLCKENNLHTVVETCGYFPADILEAAVAVTDLFLWDMKDTDPERHKTYTGVSPEHIHKNLFLADALGAKTQIRCILINGINTNRVHYENIASVIKRLKHCEGVKFLPYHSYGGSKALALGRTDAGCDRWIPAKDQIAYAKEYLQKKGITVF